MTKKNIDTKASFKIAKKLFLPSFMMRLNIFVRYYFFAIIFSLIPCIYFFYLFSRLLSASLNQDSTFNVNPINWVILIVSLVVIPIATWIYFYYLKIKLRYFWFIFLDNFGKSDFSFHMIAKEMYKLNEINKSESFRRSLTINVGANAVRGIANFSIGQAVRALKKIGKGGEVAGNVVGVYGAEVTNQLASLSKITGNYMMYRFTCYICYGEAQAVNENIYKLSE